MNDAGVADAISCHTQLLTVRMYVRRPACRPVRTRLGFAPRGTIGIASCTLLLRFNLGGVRHATHCTKAGLDSIDGITPLACEDISRRVRALQFFTYWNAEASSGASATRLAGSRRSSRS
jgi:hypothetical protein